MGRKQLFLQGDGSTIFLKNFKETLMQTMMLIPKIALFIRFFSNVAQTQL